MRDLRLSAEVIRYRRERWLLPSGQTVLAPLPAGVVGGFGPELRRFVLALHAQGQVTTERLIALLSGIGIKISKRRVVRILTGSLDDFVAHAGGGRVRSPRRTTWRPVWAPVSRVKDRGARG